VLLHVERTRVEESSYGTHPRDGQSHQLTKDVCDNTQEDDGDENRLRLEVEDFLQNGAENSKTNTEEESTKRPFAVLVTTACLLMRSHIPWVNGHIIVDVNDFRHEILCVLDWSYFTDFGLVLGDFILCYVRRTLRVLVVFAEVLWLPLRAARLVHTCHRDGISIRPGEAGPLCRHGVWYVGVSKHTLLEKVIWERSLATPIVSIPRYRGNVYWREGEGKASGRKMRDIKVTQKDRLA